MAVLIANNAKSTLAAPIGALDTSLTIAAGTSTLFPVPTGGDYFYVTLEDSTKTIREIVKVTAVAGSTFTIVRAQDGTYANIFALGSAVELRINRASLTDSVGAAASSAAAAAASASSASTSAGTATTQAGISTAQAVISTTQADIATTQATNASNSATAANNSAIAAAASAASGMYSAVQDKSANYTVVAADAGDLLRITTTGGAVAITLPVISTVGDGFKIAVVKWTADGNPVNINRSGSDTINGGITSQIGSQFSQIVLVADLETSQWFASQSGLGATNVNVDVFSGTGSQTVYTLSADPSTKNNTFVSIGGVYQAKANYTVTGTTLTFSTAPPAGTSNIEVVYGTPLAIGTPSDGTVSTIKLQDNAVTTVKILDSNVTNAKIAANAVTLTKMAREGTAGQVMTSGGAGADPSYTTLVTTVPVDVQTFNTTTAWTKPTGGQTMARIQLWGGGGGGSRGGAAVTSGGGGGGYNEITVPLSYINSQTVVVGAGGVGATTTASGGTGGTSSVTLATAWDGRTTVAAYGGGGGGQGSSQTGGSGGGQLSAGYTAPGTALPGSPVIGFSSSGCAVQVWNSADGLAGTGQSNGGFWHGGSGDGARYGGGGSSIWGGGGGVMNGYSPAGTSLYGGNGGNNAPGAAPGGGGGSSSVANTNGSNGGAGRVQITCW